MRDHAARILEQAYDPRNGPVGEDVSPRLDPTGMYDAWPLLCKGPFLLPINEEAAILQGQPGRRMQGAVHERVGLRGTKRIGRLCTSRRLCEQWQQGGEAWLG